jgi:hypothetical protein
MKVDFFVGRIGTPGAYKNFREPPQRPERSSDEEKAAKRSDDRYRPIKDMVDFSVAQRLRPRFERINQVKLLLQEKVSLLHTVEDGVREVFERFQGLSTSGTTPEDRERVLDEIKAIVHNTTFNGTRPLEGFQEEVVVDPNRAGEKLTISFDGIEINEHGIDPQEMARRYSMSVKSLEEAEGRLQDSLKLLQRIEDSEREIADRIDTLSSAAQAIEKTQEGVATRLYTALLAQSNIPGWRILELIT